MDYFTILCMGALCLLILFLLLSSTRVMHGSDSYWRSQKVPIIKIHEMVSFFSRALFQTSHVDLDRRVYQSLGSSKFGGFMELHDPVFYVKDPDLNRLILIKDFDYFSERKFLGVRHADPVISRSLTNMVGAEWKQLRATVSPTFSSGRIKRMFHLVNLCGLHLVEHLENKLKESEEGAIDFQDSFGRFSVGVIASIAFYQGTDVCSENVSVFRDMAKKFQQFDTTRVLKLITYFLFPSLARALKLSMNNQKTIRFFAQIVEKNIEQRRKERFVGGGKKKHNDFLELLMEAQADLLKAEEEDEIDLNNNFEKDATLKEDGPKVPNSSGTVLDDQTIIGQCFQFFNAGNDAVESTLIFCVYALALNPPIQEKLAEEVKRVMDENGGDLTYDLVSSIEYLDMVISETLRMYPPAFATERRCAREYKIQGTDVTLPRDCRVIISIRGLHYDPKYFEEPLKFNPDHFSVENKKKRHPYAYLPFGQGPRSCIAMRFAMTEAKSAIAHVIYRYKVEPCEKTDIPMKFQEKSFLLLPLNGMYLKVTRRQHQ